MFSVNSSEPSAKEGHAFMAVLSSTQESLELRVREAERDLADPAISEDMKGHMMATIGKANLLITQKLAQFRDLCRRNIEQSSGDPFQASGSDLAGFWDVVLLQVNEVHTSFEELAVLKARNWQEPEQADCTRTPAPGPSRKAAGRPRSAVTASPRRSSQKAEQAAKARTEARKKFMEARRKMLEQSPAASRDQDAVFFAPPAEKNN